MAATTPSAGERAREDGSAARTRTIAIVAALAGGTGWMAKMFIMAAQGGPDAQSTPEAIAFFVGFAGIIVASAAAGAYMARRKPLGWRVLGAIGAVVVVALVTAAGQAGLGSLPGDGWVKVEAMLGIVGAVFFAAAITALRRATD